MRYIDLSHLREGMVLAQPFYGSKFEILLAEGMTLSTYHIQRINELGYAGVYIEDDLSAGITIEDIIPPELRVKTIKAAKEILKQAEGSRDTRGAAKVSKEHQQRIVMPVIEAIIANQNRLVDRIDLKPYGDYNYYHAANVVVLSLLLGLEMGVSGAQLYELGMAALLHDVGNVFIPKAILNKPGKLTPEEYDIVKQHTEMGFTFLRERFDISIEACVGALQHHENYDGTGYPNRLKKNKISLAGRIIALTDVFDALTSRRPFRQPLYPSEAISYLASKAGSMFDPEIVRVFRQVTAAYPSGTGVELNTGVRCIVVRNYAGDLERPCLRLLNNMSNSPLLVDLHGDPAFSGASIARIISVV